MSICKKYLSLVTISVLKVLELLLILLCFLWNIVNECLCDIILSFSMSLKTNEERRHRCKKKLNKNLKILIINQMNSWDTLFFSFLYRIENFRSYNIYYIYISSLASYVFLTPSTKKPSKNDEPSRSEPVWYPDWVLKWHFLLKEIQASWKKYWSGSATEVKAVHLVVPDNKKVIIDQWSYIKRGWWDFHQPHVKRSRQQ